MKMTPLILTLPALALAACQQQPADETAATGNAAMPGGNAMMMAGNNASAMAPAAPAAAPTDAAGYIAQAGAGDLFEIESSKVALEKSQTKAVRDFAQMMIDQHQKSTADVKAAAQKAGLTVPPPKLMPNQQQMLDEETAEWQRGVDAERSGYFRVSGAIASSACSSCARYSVFQPPAFASYGFAVGRRAASGPCRTSPQSAWMSG